MRILYALCLSCLFMMNSCKDTNSQNNQQQGEGDKIENNRSSTVSSTEINADIVISDASGTEIGGFDLAPIKIVYGDDTYKVKSKSDKHKFYRDGSMVYEVKLKSESIKLRNQDSELLWKVKSYADKIKISDNEENKNPFEIKRYEDKIKIKKNEETLYEVKVEGISVLVNDVATYTISSPQDSYLYAVLAIKEISEVERMFILAELLGQQ